MSSPRAAAGLLVLWAACAPPTEWLPWPTPEAQTLVLLYQAEQELTAVAFPREGSRIELEVPGLGEGAPLWALAYDGTAEALGLPRGRIPAAPPGACGATPLPASGRAFEARSAGENVAWQALEPWPDAVSRFRQAGPCICPSLEVEATVDLGPGAYVLGTTDRPGVLLVAEFGGPSPAVHYLSIEGRGARIGAFTGRANALVERSGVVFVAATTGIRAGPPEGPLTEILPATVVGQTRSLAIRGPDEIWISTSSAVVGRIDRLGALTEVFRFDGPTGPVAGNATVGADGAVYATVTYEGILLTVRDGQIARSVTFDINPEQVTAMAEVPGVGLVLGSDRAQLLVFDGLTVQALAQWPTRLGLIAILPIPGGFVTFNKAGGLIRYGVGLGLCPQEGLLAEQRLGSGVVVDGRPVVVGVDATGFGRAFFLR